MQYYDQSRRQLSLSSSRQSSNLFRDPYGHVGQSHQYDSGDEDYDPADIRSGRDYEHDHLRPSSGYPPPPTAADLAAYGIGITSAGRARSSAINNLNRSESGGRKRWCYLAAAAFVIVGVVGIVAFAIASAKSSAANEESSDPQANPDSGGDDTKRKPADDSSDSGNLQSPTRLSQLGQLISSVSPTGGQEFADPLSYQSAALRWLEATEDAVTMPAVSRDASGSISQTDRYIQRYALACILFATDGVRTDYTDYQFDQSGISDVAVPGWSNKRKWPLQSDEAEDECTWHGIICDDGGYVEELLLESNLLTGTMPPETALLSKSLAVMNVSGNLMYNVGDEGNNWLGELTKLEYLYMADTAFQYDGIPTAIGKLTKLRGLDCSYTLYFGPLRKEVFENLKGLEYLYIGGNSFGTSVPTVLSTLPKLRSFYSEYSDITGDLSFMVGMQAIYELWIDRNPELSGTIPSGIGDLITLASFSVTECDLRGTIPPEMGNLSNMKQLWLYSNRLSGEIPETLSNMGEMEILELQDNDLVGSVDALCTTIAYPYGSLETLGVDCLDDISCPSTCCSCCNSECFDDSRRGRRLGIENDASYNISHHQFTSHDKREFPQSS